MKDLLIGLALIAAAGWFLKPKGLGISTKGVTFSDANNNLIDTTGMQYQFVASNGNTVLALLKDGTYIKGVYNAGGTSSSISLTNPTGATTVTMPSVAGNTNLQMIVGIFPVTASTATTVINTAATIIPAVVAAVTTPVTPTTTAAQPATTTTSNFVS